MTPAQLLDLARACKGAVLQIEHGAYVYAGTITRALTAPCLRRRIERVHLDVCTVLAHLIGRREEDMTKKLETMLEDARKVKMTPLQREAQRRSFVYGNTKIANNRITPEMVNEVAERLAEVEPYIEIAVDLADELSEAPSGPGGWAR